MPPPALPLSRAWVVYRCREPSRPLAELAGNVRSKNVNEYAWAEVQNARLLQPSIRNVDDAETELGQSLQILFGDGKVRVLEQPEPDRLMVDVATDGAEIINAGLLIDCHALMLEEFVQFRVGVVGQGKRAARVEIGVHLDVRINSIGDAPGRKLELSCKGTRRNRRLVDLLQLDFGTDFLPGLLKDLPIGATSWCRCEEHLELNRFAVFLY